MYPCSPSCCTLALDYWPYQPQRATVGCSSQHREVEGLIQQTCWTVLAVPRRRQSTVKNSALIWRAMSPSLKIDSFRTTSSFHKPLHAPQRLVSCRSIALLVGGSSCRDGDGFQREAAKIAAKKTYWAGKLRREPSGRSQREAYTSSPLLYFMYLKGFLERKRHRGDIMGTLDANFINQLAIEEKYVSIKWRVSNTDWMQSEKNDDYE